ncbi:MAG: 50S ribosomal protein L11 methyltransferase [Bacteroidota bacterium]
MKTYLEVSISASENQREMLLPTLIELGFQGFEETDTHLVSYLDKTRWNDGQIAKMRNDLKSLLREISVNADIQMREIREENWNALWEKTIQPIEVGNNLIIKPSWSDYHNIAGKIIVQIDPKMSFGTGYHETTRLTLRLLEKYLQPGNTLLDVGTGTGILAIAAVKLGAASAWGIDLDEWSIENAQENIASNGVSDKIAISNTPIDQINRNFHLIAANLTLNTNSELLPSLYNHLRDPGIILLSGLLTADAHVMRSRLQDNQFSIQEELFENEWIAIAAKK